MKTPLVIVSAAAAAAVVAAGGIAGASFLSGGGTQPEEVLPAATIAFAKADLDPSAGQKLNVLRLAKKFPSVKIDGEDLKATIGKALLEDNDLGLSYATDIEPWVGDRIAVAAVAVPGSKDGVAPVVAIQFTDEAKMTAALDKAQQKVNEQSTDPTAGAKAPGSDDGIYYAVRDDFVLVSDSQQEVDSFTDGATLAEDDDFATDKDSIDGDGQIVLGWVDVAGAYDAVPAQDKQDFAKTLGTVQPAGTMVFGIKAGSDYLEATGKTHDLSAAGIGTSKVGSTPGTGMVADFPADTSAALAITGLGPVAVDLWKKFGDDADLGLDGPAKAMGLDLPADLEAVFGTDLAAYAKLSGSSGSSGSSDSEGAVRVKTDQPERAMELLTRLFREGGAPKGVQIVAADGGYLVGYQVGTADESTDGVAGLGDSPGFEKAVQDGVDANALLYVDIADVVDSLSSGSGMFADEKSLRELKPLRAFGFSSTGNVANGEFTARLTTR